MTDRPTMQRRWLALNGKDGDTSACNYDSREQAEQAAELYRTFKPATVIEVIPRTPATDVADDAVAALRELLAEYSAMWIDAGGKPGQFDNPGPAERARAILARVDGGGNHE